MSKTIALQSTNQILVKLLQQQGYTVIDMYQAHQQRELVDAYLYTTHHPDALTSYDSAAEAWGSISGNTAEIIPSATLMLNITDLPSKQVLATLERRLQPK